MGKLNFSVALVIAMIVLPSPSVGKFNLIYYISCKEKYLDWCAWIRVDEYDKRSGQAWNKKKACISGNDRDSNITVDFGEIDPLNDHVKLRRDFFVVEHNCSATGKTHCYAPPMYMIDMKGWKDQVVKVSLALSDKGDKEGPCLFNKIYDHFYEK